MGRIPPTGPQMQARHFCGRDLLQASPQNFSKEGMVGIPLPLVIKWAQKEVGPFQLLQKELTVLLLQDRIAQSIAQTG
jgi:hypothetical protein